MSNAYDVVELFERRVAEFAGAPHAVAVDCCTSAIFLCLKAFRSTELNPYLTIPARTYVSVPMAIVHAGGSVRFRDYAWSGVYNIEPTPVWDGAKRFRRGMFGELAEQMRGRQRVYLCLSFHTKKHLAIGRGGMILTDSADMASVFRRMRYDGREGKPYPEERISQLGWHCYMTPEQAARGLMLLDVLPDDLPDQTEDYPDLRTFPIFQDAEANRGAA